MFKAQLLSSREHQLPTSSCSKPPAGRGGTSETPLGQLRQPQVRVAGGPPGPRPFPWHRQVKPFDTGMLTAPRGRFTPKRLRGGHELPDKPLTRTLGSGQPPVSRWQRQPLREVALLAGSPRTLGTRCSHEASGIPFYDPEVWGKVNYGSTMKIIPARPGANMLFCLTLLQGQTFSRHPS